jgi:hypothetical protein
MASGNDSHQRPFGSCSQDRCQGSQALIYKETPDVKKIRDGPILIQIGPNFDLVILARTRA